MCDSEEQGTENDRQIEGHTAQQAHKDEATKEEFLTYWSDKNRHEQRSIGGNGSNFAARENDLIIGLYLPVKEGNDALIQVVGRKNDQAEEYNKGKSSSDIELLQAQCS